MMAATHIKKLLLLTLVHPDFLPPVYASAQVLRDEGYEIHILTFDSFVPANLDLGSGIVIEPMGKHHGIGLMQRLQLRKKYTARARQLAGEGPAAIISYCAFTYLCGLKVKGNLPIIYHAMEVADFIPSLFMRSPLSHINNYRALKNVHKADMVATPSVQRSAWLAGRSHLEFMPSTVLNTAYISDTKQPSGYDVFKFIVPAAILDKKIVLYTGAVNAHLCIMELVQAFDQLNDESSALVITGIKDNAYCNEVKDFVVKSRAAGRIKLLPYVTRAEMLALQENANIGVCLAREYDDNVESKMMSPNKVGEYLSKGLYLLSIRSEYMKPFGMNGIASLAGSTNSDDISMALTEALAEVSDGSYKARVQHFVQDYFCMQQQLKPIVAFLKTK
jgi:glycosyltransferase involved in cell wall biosynthesis